MNNSTTDKLPLATHEFSIGSSGRFAIPTEYYEDLLVLTPEMIDNLVAFAVRLMRQMRKLDPTVGDSWVWCCIAFENNEIEPKFCYGAEKTDVEVWSEDEASFQIFVCDEEAYNAE